MNTHSPGHILFEKYRIERTLDVGGQSVVYQAHQLGIGRKVALKIVRTDQSPKVMDTLIKRFAREAKLLGQLQDPHTITLHDFGTAPDGSLYMVCEYIPGRDLKHVIAEDGALEPARVVSILRQMMDPLKEAHSKGILHRDIKPANIMLSEFNGQADFVKVLDFGIAKIMEETTKLTGINSVVGTPRYIAPEAIRRLELTPAYDLYSAGMIAYNLLTAKHPLADLPIKDLLLEIANGPDYKLPSTLEVPQALRDIIHKMLRKDRRVRYQSAREVIDALDALGSLKKQPTTNHVSEPQQVAAPQRQVAAPRQQVAAPVPKPIQEPTFAATRQMHAIAPIVHMAQTPRGGISALPEAMGNTLASKQMLPEMTQPMQDTLAVQQDAEPQSPEASPKSHSYERNVPAGVGNASPTMMGHSMTITGAHNQVSRPATSKIVIEPGLPSEHKAPEPPSIGTLASIGPGVAQNVQAAARSTTIEIGAVNASQYGHLMAQQHVESKSNRPLLLIAGLIVVSIFLLALVILVLAILHLSQRM